MCLPRKYLYIPAASVLANVRQSVWKTHHAYTGLHMLSYTVKSSEILYNLKYLKILGSIVSFTHWPSAARVCIISIGYHLTQPWLVPQSNNLSCGHVKTKPRISQCVLAHTFSLREAQWTPQKSLRSSDGKCYLLDTAWLFTCSNSLPACAVWDHHQPVRDGKGTSSHTKLSLTVITVS